MDMRRSNTLLGAKAVLLGAVVSLSLLVAQPSGAAELEQVAISFEIPKVVTRDMLVQYDGTSMYLPVAEILRLLDINCSFDPKSQTLSGFFIHRDSTYRLDPTGGRAVIKSRDYPLLASDCFVSDNDIYLRLDLFQTAFGLPLQFDFSLLRVLLPLNEGFPSFQKLKRQQARAKLQKAEERLYNVREVPLKRDYFSGGVADWLVSANPVGGGGHYFDLTLGSMLLGGDFSLAGTGSTVTGFDADRLSYRWRYTFNPNPLATEVELGNVFPVGMLGRTMKGLLLTNRPLVQRTHFQTVHITGKLDPGWEAEMYIDNKLVDFTTSDQTGEYDFTVGLSYGSSVMTVKLFGPNGEVRSEEREIRIPYNLVPKGTTEYSFGAGTVLTPYGERPHVQSSAHYGITTRLTFGLGADVPAAPRESERFLYGTEATYQVFGSMTVNGAFSPNNQTSIGMNYSLPSFATASASFTRFYDNPYNVNVKQQSSAIFSISAPFKVKDRYFGTRLYVARDVYETFKSVSINCGLNSSFWLVHSSYIGKFKISSYSDRSVRTLVSQMLLSADFFRWLKPQVRIDYDHGQNAVSKLGVYLNKRLFRTGQLTLSYERNVPSRSSSVMVTFNVFNQAAYFSTRMLYSDRRVSMNQMQRGSIRYDRIGGAVRFDRRNSVGYGTAVVRPFLDANNDGIVGEGESYLPGIRARVSGVGGRMSGPDKLYYYDGLRPYDGYIVQVDPASLDDPTLRPVYENFKVELTPNVVTTIDVPIVPASDISGIVFRQSPEGKFGLGGIKVKILNISRDIVTELTTFNNGEFYYLGLVPGNYRAYIDPDQLSQFGYTTLPESIQFEVKPSITGTTVDKIEFSLIPKP